MIPDKMDAKAVMWVILIGGCLCLAKGQSLPELPRAPVTLRVDRNWYVSPSAPVGHFVAQVQREYTDGPPLTFSLETARPPAPFRIDPHSGIVYVNDTLTNKVNNSYSLWVIASNGDVPNKLEVLATVTDTPGSRRVPRPPFPLPYPPKVPSYTLGTPPPIKHTTLTTEDTSTENEIPLSTLGPPKPPEDLNKNMTIIDNGINETKDKNLTEVRVTTENELSVMVIPLVAIVALVILIVVVVMFVMKRNNGKKPHSKKEDMSKEPNCGEIVLQDASLHGWDGPRAFSNRYESWDNSHLQLSDGEVPRDDTKEQPQDEWEFPRHRLRVFNIVGEGAFGQVWRAQAIDIDGLKGEVTVAVKTLKENASEKEKSDLLQELQVMKGLGTHPNVVRLLACCTEKEPTFVIMEFVSLGKLQSFLRDSRAERHYGNTHGGSQLTSRDLTHYAYQVARGMHFLSEKGIIHRDLAARNVLITEERTCKVADFGFARDVAGTHVYERKSDGRLPIRWMAPESLYDDIFSMKSDIWSFGVLVWEIVTLGSTPYPGLSAGDVMRKVRDGHRLEKPEHCRRELYNIMYYCWEAEPTARPDFNECVELLEKLLCTETDYIELERFPDHSYYNVQHLDGEKL